MTESNSDSVETGIEDWTSPPDKRPTQYVKYEPIADALRERPRDWARLPDRSSPSAAYQFAVQVKRGLPVAFRPAGAFEGAFAGRSVWVRYLGADVEEEVKNPTTIFEDPVIEEPQPQRPAQPDRDHLFSF